MTTSRPSGAGRPGRTWTRLGLMTLALATLGLEGCASLGIGNTGCGTGRCGSLLGKCSLSRFFHRRPTASAVAVDGCVEPGIGMPIESGDPSFFSPSPTPLAPLPPADLNPDLLPINSAPGGSGGSETGANSKPVKSLYQSRDDRSRGGALEARREAGLRPSRRGDDPLAGIADLSVPNAPVNPEVSPPVPPSEVEPPSFGVPPAADDLPDTSSTTSAGVAPGIRRFKVIEPRLAAGSLPTEAGWKWLVGLGYKTVIDLRETSEVRQEELAAIAHHGLRHVPLPASKTVIDPALVVRFEAEVAEESARPIFVFDDDGVRPASFGFIHLVVTQKQEKRVAEREVEDLGAGDSPLWRSTLGFLAGRPDSTVDSSPRILPISLRVREDDSEVGLTLSSGIEAPAPAAPAHASWRPLASAWLGQMGSAIIHGSQALANPPAKPIPSSSAHPESGG